MFWDPFVLDVLFLLHIRKGLISMVTLSIVVPQAIGSFLRNIIGDHTRDVPCFYLGFGGTMCSIFLTFSLFLLVFMLHFIVCSSIDTHLYWFDPYPVFYNCLLCIRRFLAKSHVHMHIFGQKSRIHTVFWPNSTYTCSFLVKSHIYMQLFFKQLCTSSLLVSLMLWEVVEWVVSVVGYFFCDQRLFFHWFFFESNFSHLSFLFCH